MLQTVLLMKEVPGDASSGRMRKTEGAVFKQGEKILPAVEKIGT